MKTTELGLLLQVLPVRIIAFVETLRSHLKQEIIFLLLFGYWDTRREFFERLKHYQ